MYILWFHFFLLLTLNPFSWICTSNSKFYVRRISKSNKYICKSNKYLVLRKNCQQLNEYGYSNHRAKKVVHSFLKYTKNLVEVPCVEKFIKNSQKNWHLKNQMQCRLSKHFHLQLYFEPINTITNEININ